MKKIIYLFLVGIIAISVGSCQKDLGNYTYTELNEVEIGGIDSIYALSVGDSLIITPTLTFATDMDTSLFEYGWYYGTWNANVSAGIELLQGGYTLNLLLDLQAGTHELYFQVTEKATGIVYIKVFNIFLGTLGYEGWLLLSDIDGQARLDILSYSEGFYVPYLDILDAAGSSVSLTGAPVSVGLSTINPGTQIFVVTSTEGYNLHPSSYERGYLATPYSVLIPSSASIGYADSKSYHNFFTDYIYSNGDGYARNFWADGALYYGTIGPFNNTPDNIRFNMAPFIATTEDWNSPQAVIFNEDTKTMYRYEGTTTSTISNPLPIEGLELADYELVFMEYSTYNGGFVFALFEQEDTGLFYLAQFSMNGVLTYFREVDGPEIENAEHFTISPQWGYFLYAAGGSVYEHDAAIGTTTLMLSYPNEEVSYLAYPRSSYTNYPGYSSNEALYTTFDTQLIVCTYNPNDPNTSGRIQRYNVPTVNQPFILLESYDGFGKIVSVVYNEKR